MSTQPATIAAEIQTLAPSAIIEMFEIDATIVGGVIYRFHPGKNNLLTDIIWQGQAYSAFPIEADGFEWNGRGQLPRPKIRVSNVLGTISALVLAHEDLVGCKVTRIRTLAKFLDAGNFPDRRNLLTYTQDFTNAIWLKDSATVNPDVALAPDGTMTADQLVTTNRLYWFDNTGVTGVKTQSIYIKKDAQTTFSITAVGSQSVAGGNTVTVNLVTGTVTTAHTTANVLLTSIPNGWYRLEIKSTVTTASGNASYWQIGVNTGVFLWGAQLEAGWSASAYQAIGGSFSRNPTADPTAEFARDVYFVDRKSAENRDQVEFELAAALDIAGVQLPRRQVIQNYCPWKYRGAECGYTGTAYFDTNDASVPSAGQDVCGKRLTSCRVRFGQYAELPYGGFPAAGLLRV